MAEAWADAMPLLIWQCDPEGKCDYFNRGWLEFTGRAIEQQLGNGWSECMHPEDLPRVMDIVRGSLDRREPFQMEYRVRHQSGEWQWILDRGVPRFSPESQYLGFVGGCLDITDRKRIAEELAAAKLSAERAMAIAEEASRAKDHFLAVLSHELRTPLTPVLAGVTMLQADARLDRDTHDLLAMMRRNAEVEVQLIDGLLDATRIARGKIELKRQRIQLCEVISRAVSICRPDIESRGTHLGVDIGPDAPYLLDADLVRLQQVFWNLLRNAIKFTPRGECIGIRCRLDNHHAVAEVNDSGIGIDPESLQRIFRAFEQGEPPTTRQFGGLGLGLPICKALVEMHGGTIEPTSEGT
ncbi:MAG: ATP-binding protein [Bacillota bacterium]